MKLILANPRGFCAGVYMAIDVVDQILDICDGDPIYVYHEIVHNKHVVDELCQETFLRFLKNLRNVRERMSLRGFIVKIAIHVTQDYFRKKYRRPEEELIGDRVSPAADPAEAVLRRVDLQKALEGLPEKSRRILLMRADGYKYEEISAETKMSVSSVKMQVKRNLAKLRSALDVTISTLAATVVLKWLFELVQTHIHG